MLPLSWLALSQLAITSNTKEINRMPATLSYITVGADDTEAAVRFYDAIMATLGRERLWREDPWVGYGNAGTEHAELMVCKPYDGNPTRPANGVTIGLHADTPAQVDAFHAAALASGGSCEGAPGPRPAYSPNIYIAYVRDPHGNKLSACCQSYVPPA